MTVRDRLELLWLDFLICVDWLHAGILRRSLTYQVLGAAAVLVGVYHVYPPASWVLGGVAVILYMEGRDR